MNFLSRSGSYRNKFKETNPSGEHDVDKTLKVLDEIYTCNGIRMKFEKEYIRFILCELGRWKKISEGLRTIEDITR